jgi:hypothetical protein
MKITRRAGRWTLHTEAGVIRGLASHQLTSFRKVQHAACEQLGRFLPHMKQHAWVTDVLMKAEVEEETEDE